MTTTAPTSPPPLAIVGVSALFPGSSTATGLWSDICTGTDRLGPVPASHWLTEDYYDPDPSAPDKTYANRGGFIDPIDFDPVAWGIPPKLLRSTDTTQLLALIAAEQVLQDAARGRFATMDRSRVSVILGVTSAQELIAPMISRLQRPVWVKALRDHGVPEDDVQAICDRISDHYVPWEESSFPGLLGNVVAGRVANRLDLGGANCVIDAACASTLAALNMGMQELWQGDSELVIAGGADTLNDIFMFMCFSKTPALSPTGDCRPFSADADGTMLGEGLGMVALRRLADAERDGDKIYAVVRGLGSSSDGRGNSVYAPSSAGQAQALRRAYAQAGFDPRTIELVEAHGTGTKAGDAAEVGGLKLAFETDDGETTARPWCALGSIKAQVGHTKAAAGAAGLIKAALALHHKVLPPTIKVDRPNPKLGLEGSPLYLNTEARPWIRDSRHPRRAGVSAFGFGGSNFHVALEEYTGPGDRAERLRVDAAELVVVRGDTAAEVTAQARQWASRCDEPGIVQWAAWSSHRGSAPSAPVRLAVVASDAEDLRAKLERACTKIDTDPHAAFVAPDGTAYGVGEQAGAVGLLFPGQGSQAVGMTGTLAMRFDVARRAWDQAADLDLGDASPIHEVVFPHPKFSDEDRQADTLRLRQTQWAQPALGAASLAMLAIVRALGIEASAVAGHSFGEVMALHAAGVLEAGDALAVARRRGEIMAEAASAAGQPGSMSAVVASASKAGDILDRAAVQGVVLANHNAPTQTVVSGPTAAIEQAESALQAAGLKVQRLPVATAFHSPLVAHAVEPFAAALESVDFGGAQRPVYSGASATPYEADPGAQRARLAQALAEPVRFDAVIEAMADAGVHTFIEVGPGSVLTGLVGEILGERDHAAVALDRRGLDGHTALLRGVARLVALGVTVDLDALWADHREPTDPATRARPRLAIPISGANHEQPYPPPGGFAALPLPNPPRPAAVGAHDAEPRMPNRQPDSSPNPVAPASSNSTVEPPAAPSMPTSPVAAVARPAWEPAPTLPAAAPVGDGWLAAWQEGQQQAAQAHAHAMQAMSNAHVAFMQTMETSVAGLAAMAGAPLPAAARAPLTMPAMEVAAAPLPASAPAPAFAAPTPHAPAEPGPTLAPPPTSARPPTVSTQPPAATPSALDLEALMLEVVADKTGYPPEMLALTMDMEAELGIDSIKRVEILAAVQERVPSLPEVDAAKMGALRTLEEVVETMRQQLGSSPLATATPGPAASPATSSTLELETIMLAVVADKTGYPPDMLDLNMDMEAELGIDSIKRVEILAAVQERVPSLPEVDAAKMGALRTLAEVVETMRQQLGSPLAAVTSSGPTEASPTSTSSAAELETIMLEVVADKTGYPPDMLDLTMDMEAELGIDSIKRVEILAAVQERVPSLPEVDAAKMGALRTLAEVVETMRQQLGAPAAPTSPAEAVPGSSPARPDVATAPSPTEPLDRHALELVDAPALGLARPGLSPAGGLVVTDDGAGVSAALVTELQRRGIEATLVHAVPADAAAVVFMGGLRAVADEAAAVAVMREAFTTARTVAPGFTERGGLFVTVQDTGGGFGLEPCPHERCFLAGLPALVKTAAIEWPTAHTAAIDLQCGGRSPDAIAEALAEELLHGGTCQEIAIMADGRRRTLHSSLAPRTDTTARPDAIGKGEVVVVSGGARGVTAACIMEWARRSQASFVLLGRSPLDDEHPALAGIEDPAALSRALLEQSRQQGETLRPVDLSRRAAAVTAAREVRATLAAIAEAGGQARYVRVDVTDAQAVTTALEEVRGEWGPIAAVVHGAGVLADKRIAQLQDDAFDRVVSTKVTGIQALLQATASDPLRVLCLFSSVAARSGNQGQVAYAMANEVLDKVAQAQARRRPTATVTALCWGPWAGGMVDASLRGHFAQRGIALIELDQGAKMFADEVQARPSAGPQHVELVIGASPDPGALTGLHQDTQSREFELHLHPQSHRWLLDHRVADVVVVPVAAAMEWFARAACGLCPRLHLQRIADLKVLRPLALSTFATAGARLTLRAYAHDGRNGDGTVVGLELLDAAGVVCYRAQATMAARSATLDAAPGQSPGPLRPLTDAELYDGRAMFHGPAFHLIEQLDGVADDGIVGTVQGVATVQATATMGWTAEPWRLDLAAIDGGLQLGVLWGRERLGGAVLPMGVSTIECSASTVATGPVHVVVHVLRSTRAQATADITLRDQQGSPIVVMRGVTFVLRPDRPPARVTTTRPRAQA